MKKFISLFASCLLLSQLLFAQKIYTIAGNGFLDYSGNGGAATAAQFYNPNGVAKDDSGNIYIVDQGNNCVRRINATNGNLVPFAGNTIAGYKGDNGAAVSAELNNPSAVATDVYGNVYIADQGNSLVREVTISTRKINYIAGLVSHNIPINGYVQAQDGGLAAHAELNQPDGLAIAPTGDIYISDRANQRIREVSQGHIFTICGRDSIINNDGPNGLYFGDGGYAWTADVDNPAGLALDSAGNLYIADEGNYRIRVISNQNQKINTICGSNTANYNGDLIRANTANLNHPTGVAIGKGGNIYITDNGNNRIRMIKASSDTIYTVAGNGVASYAGDGGPATGSMLSSPNSIISDDSGRIYFTDGNNMRLREINKGDSISYLAGCGTGGYSGNMMPSLSASIRYPNQVTLDTAGNLYFADQTNNVVRKIMKSGSNLQNDTIITVAGNGTLGYSGDNGAATAAMLNLPSSVAVDDSGNMYIADVQNNVVRKVGAITGSISTVAGNGTGGYAGDNGPATAAELFGPYSVAVDNVGNVYIADNKNYRIRKITKSTGMITTVVGNGIQGYNGDNKPATAAELSSPVGLAFDAANNLYISDNGTDRISKVTVSGTIKTIAGNGIIGYWGDGGPATAAEFDQLHGISLDKSGNVYVADAQNEVVREISTTDSIKTVAGTKTQDTVITRVIVIKDTTYDTVVTVTGIAGFYGDGGLATAAKLNYPEGVAVDKAGNLYITDFGNQRIRVVTTAAGLSGIATVTLPFNKATVYPNPSGGKFSIQSPLVLQTTEVFNILGKQIASIPSRGGVYGMDLSSQPAGIYLYRIVSQTGALLGSGKLIIAK